jgi:anaerobic magnesium-protoporphyrin IX monomethyl ester cyclase
VDNVLFIVPPNISFDSFKYPAANERVVAKNTGNYGSIVNEIPIGLLSISAYLKKNTSVRTQLIDFNIVINKLDSFTWDSFAALFQEVLSSGEITDFAPSIIGISALFTPSYQSLLDIAKCCKELYPMSLVIAGGGVPTNMYSSIFHVCPYFDALCYGEGELPLLGLLQSDNKQKYLSEHPSWITKDKTENANSLSLDLIDDLDEIPFLDFSLIHVDDYMSNSINSLFPLAQKQLKNIGFMASRGCVHRCCFCSSHTVHGRKMRYYSVQRVKEELEHLKNTYGAGNIIFFDDHFMADKKRVLEIIEIMKSLQLTAFFPNSLALYALDRSILEALKGIGVNHLVLSVESGSGRVLKEIMHKPLNPAIVEQVVKDCRDLGIATDLSILIGLPGETKQDIEDARVFLRSLTPNWFRISIATPLAGSEMLEICIDNDFLRGDYLSCDFKKAIVETSDFTPEYITEKAYELNLELNFVANSDFRLGQYSVALKGFENTVRVKTDHALAHYFAAKCCRELCLEQKYLDHKLAYNQIIGASEYWKSHALHFELADLE